MLPWLILGVAAIMALVIGAGVMRSTRRTERAGESPADQAEVEREFEDAERYQEQWRKEHHKDFEDEAIP